MFTRRLRYWLESAKREAALRSEMELHIEEVAAELGESGLSEKDARAEARRRFGNFGLKQEESREIWIARRWSEFWHDARFGARTLVAQPGFTIPTVLALLLGIAVNAIVFNVYNGVALAPWAVRDAKRTVQVLAERGSKWGGFSWPHFRYLQAHTTTLEGLAAYSGTDTRVRRGDSYWTADAVTASENFFDLIGTGFAAGRGFSGAGSNVRDPAAETVLHYDTWVTQFGADPGIVGSWIELSGHRLQVVGVATPGFNGPTPNVTNMWVPGAWGDIFNPGLDTIDTPDACCISVIGRLKPGVSRAAAQAELTTLSAQFLTDVKREPSRVLLTNPSFLANPTMHSRASVVFMAAGAASFFILLLACANVANLQLARSLARRREIAVRLSLGASRGRILRQLMVESVLLSGIAGAGALAISAWAPGATFAIIAGPSERLAFRFSNDLRVMAFVLCATLAAAVLFGFLPALNAVRDGTAFQLRDGGRATSTHRMRSVLLTAQVALCAILLSGTALLVRALDRARHLDPGFRYEDVIVMSTGLDASGATDEQSRLLLVPLVERISSLPGVEIVAQANVIPFGNIFRGTSVPDPRTKEQVSLGFNEVSAGFFETLRIPLLAGRPFSGADETTADTVIVNEAAAQRLWPGENPLGKKLELRKQCEVIGVVRNSGTRGFGSEQDPYVWVPSQGSRGSRLLIRHSGNLEPLLAELPKLARAVDRRFFAIAAPYGETMAAALRSADISAAVASVLGGLSLLLACVGIYGVAAYNVSQRTREVGVRIALGARPGAILAMILRQNLRAVAVGAVAGIAGAIAFARVLTNMLYGVKPTDPVALLLTIAVLCATATFATGGPALRASRVDPAVTLRHE